MDGSPLALENQICFRVYSLERAIMAAYKPVLGALGLTYPQYLVMLVLWERSEATVGGLCNLLGLDTGTISPLLKRMERNGYIQRNRMPSDERTVMIKLTDAGRRLRNQAADVPALIGSCLFGAGESFDAEGYLALRLALDSALAALGSKVTGKCATEK